MAAVRAVYTELPPPYAVAPDPFAAELLPAWLAIPTRALGRMPAPVGHRLLGAAVVGENAGELIAELVLAMEMDATAGDLALTIHPHPTLSETLMEAAEAFYGTSTHIHRPKAKGGRA